MNRKNFIATSLVIVIVVSALVSWITISMMPPVVCGPEQEGTINVGGLETDITNVIIVDSSIRADVSDIMTFSDVIREVEYSTSVADDLVVDGVVPYVRPFLLRNEGTVRADLSVRQTTPGLFSMPGSYVKYWFAEPIDYRDDNVLVSFDNCVVSGPGTCVDTDVLCTELGKCDLTTSLTPPIVISGFLYENPNDEMHMHVSIYAASDEPATTKTTTVVIEAVASL